MKGQICLFIPWHQSMPCIFSRLMVAIVHLMPEQNHTCNCGFSFGLNQLNYRFSAQDNHLHRTKYICSGLEWMSRFLRRKLNFKFPIIRFLLRTLDIRREKSRWDQETMKWVTLSEVYIKLLRAKFLAATQASRISLLSNSIVMLRHRDDTIVYRA